MNGTNMQQPKVVYEVSSEDMILIRENNRLMAQTLKLADKGRKRWLTSDETANHIGRSRDYVVRVLAKKIPASQDGGDLRFDIHDIDTYMEKNKRIKR